MALAAYQQMAGLDSCTADTLYKLATLLLELGKTDEAVETFKSALTINPDLVFASYRLATLGKSEMPAKAPDVYVSEIYDAYADRFDEELVGKLGYQGPQYLLSSVNRHFNNEAKELDILDLGCGTGLCGVAFSAIARRIVGVDLSGKMLAKAVERGVYNDLIHADICRAMERFNEKFDLVLSGDTFIYTGALDKVFFLVRKCLHDNGIFAFTVELNDSGDDYHLCESGRYKHSQDYIRRLAVENGFKMLSETPFTLRHEVGQPVDSSVYVLSYSSSD